ncbi:hypothetical protein VE04_07324 [Pseudogymnoascus sp. 24MN13]|nr:hypothetical protein VE04_07324 [Pseudogymnoascus sp. 24MN13]
MAESGNRARSAITQSSPRAWEVMGLPRTQREPTRRWQVCTGAERDSHSGGDSGGDSGGGGDGDGDDEAEGRGGEDEAVQGPVGEASMELNMEKWPLQRCCAVQIQAGDMEMA